MPVTLLLIAIPAVDPGEPPSFLVGSPVVA
jgi:hypothetical protein